MDRKSIIILVVSVALLFAIPRVVDRFFPPAPLPEAPVAGETNQVASASTNAPVVPPAPSTQESVAPAGMSQNAPAVTSSTFAKPSAPEKTVVLSNQDLALVFSSHGGGIKLVELKEYPAAISCARDLPAEKILASLNTRAQTPILALLGNQSIQGDNEYKLTQNGNIVRAEKTLPNGLRVIKEVTIGSNYLFSAKVRLENTTDKSLTVPDRQLVIGTASQMSSTDDPTLVGTYWYNGQKAEEVKETWFANRTLGCIPGERRSQYSGGVNNVVWGSIQNQFFTLAAIPEKPAPQIVINAVQLPPPLSAQGKNTSSLTNGYQAAFAYPSTVLNAGQSLERSYSIYAGPKEYKRLAAIGQKMNNNLDVIMGFGGFFGFFSKVLLLSMNGLHAIGLGYGLAIIGITVIIKLVFWPLTNASTKSMKRMQTLQPQLKAIADKYKDDPAKKNQKTMEFMKEHKVNPLGGCLPMLLQIPVFFGFYWMLRSAIELRGVSFLWACDLSQADTVAFVAGFPINPMPLIMGATMLWQARLTPPSPGMDPAQQKMMRYMPLMFIVFLYPMSAGLTLYWTVQNLLTIVQTKLTKTTDEPGATGAKPGLAPQKKKK